FYGYTLVYLSFLFNATAPTEISTLSLHDALPISDSRSQTQVDRMQARTTKCTASDRFEFAWGRPVFADRMSHTWLSSSRYISLRSEEHTSELQSLAYLVCRLLLEKKKN